VVGSYLHFASDEGSSRASATCYGPPAMVYSLIVGVTGSTGQFIKLRWLQPLETVHLLIEIVACAGRDSFVYASVGKHRGLSSFVLPFFLLFMWWFVPFLIMEISPGWVACAPCLMPVLVRPFWISCEKIKKQHA
jgi:hypothetical protein